jgi:hypothetical protein
MIRNDVKEEHDSKIRQGNEQQRPHHRDTFIDCLQFRILRNNNAITIISVQ